MDSYRERGNAFKYIAAAILILVAAIGLIPQIKTPTGSIGIIEMKKMLKWSDYLNGFDFGFFNMSAISDVVEGMVKVLALLMFLSILIPVIEALLALILRKNMLPPILIMSLVINLVIKGIFMQQISRINTLITETGVITADKVISADPAALGIWIVAHVAIIVILCAALISSSRREKQRELFRKDEVIVERPM